MKPGLIIFVAVAFALAVKLFVLDAVVVEGRSMLPSLEPGNVIVVLRSAYGLRWPSGRYLLRWGTPRRGEIVAATSPRTGVLVVKRVAAVGPTFLAVEADRLLGPGLDVELEHAIADRLGSRPEIPKGAVFLLGDNPPESVDSRDYGPVPIEELFGKVLFSSK